MGARGVQLDHTVLLIDGAGSHGNTGGEVTHNSNYIGIGADLLCDGSSLIAAALIVIHNDLNLLAQNTALGIPLLNRHLGGVPVAQTELRVLAGHGSSNSNFKGVFLCRGIGIGCA